MTKSEKKLLHLRCADILDMISSEQAKITVCSKMLSHTDEAGKRLYQEQGDMATANMCALEVKYRELVRQLTDTARPLTRAETELAVSEMTNMGIAELTAKHN